MKRIIAAVAGVMFSTGVTAAPVLNSANGHYYEYVAAAATFDTALAAASNLTFAGYTGYLATVTSEAERDFIFASVTSSPHWLAGSDAAVEGTWRWLTGPEVGQIFWQDGTTVTYANWGFTAGYPPEPNNDGNEDGLLANFHSNRSNWNDTRAGWSFAYLVEYSPLVAGVPEPGTWMLLITGFGAVGVAARTRRRLLRAAAQAAV